MSDTSQTPHPGLVEPKVNPAARPPEPGAKVLYTGELAGDGALHAVVAKAVGMTCTLAVLQPSGNWIPQYQVPFDPTGETRGSWRPCPRK